MARQAEPIIAGTPGDPAGVDSLERAAIREFARRLRRVAAVYVAALERIPAAPVVNARYSFELLPGVLDALLTSAGFEVDEILLDGGAENLWFTAEFVAPAYARGTSQTLRNLAKQSPVYRAARPDMRTLINSEPYRRRIALLKAREFEEMKGFAGGAKANLARILTDGIARGRNPLAIARNIKEQTGIEQYRAERIARTEVTTALRRARLDESDDAADEYALNMRQMHLSALSPTTRRSHAERHGNLYTSEQVRDWYSEGGNSINCKCSQSEVLVDNNGEPLVKAATSRVRAAKVRYFENLEE